MKTAMRKIFLALALAVFCAHSAHADEGGNDAGGMVDGSGFGGSDNGGYGGSDMGAVEGGADGGAYAVGAWTKDGVFAGYTTRGSFLEAMSLADLLGRMGFSTTISP